MLLLDTDILVDIFRGYLPALRWLRALDNASIGIPGPAVMELMHGCRDMQRLAPYRIYWPTANDCDRALRDYGRRRLSHGIGVIDALIGECAVGNGSFAWLELPPLPLGETSPNRLRAMHP